MQKDPLGFGPSCKKTPLFSQFSVIDPWIWEMTKSYCYILINDVDGNQACAIDVMKFLYIHFYLRLKFNIK